MRLVAAGAGAAARFRAVSTPKIRSPSAETTGTAEALGVTGQKVVDGGR
jgi:hypothetical protein